MTIQAPPDGGARTTADLVFLLDVDNTLLDNDALKRGLAERIMALAGKERAARFWEIYEQVRADEDVVDYPETVRRFTAEEGDPGLQASLQEILDTVPFKSYLYPDALDTIAYLETLGIAVILSDGDDSFQPRKIKESGLEAAVHGDVLIYIHKEQNLPDVFRRYPARHYVVVDDKPRILSVLEECCPTTFTTVFVLQGHYAVEGEYKPVPDIVIRQIGDLREISRDRFLHGSSHPAAAS